MEIISTLVFIGIIIYLIKTFYKKEKNDDYDWASIEIKGLRFDQARIKVAQELKFNEKILLVPEENNAHDEFALMVTNLSGQLIGYVPMTPSRKVRSMIKKDEVLGVFATDKYLSGDYPSINIQLKLPKKWFELNDGEGDIVIDFNGNKKRVT